MHPHRFRVPTHLLVDGALFHLNLGLLVLRLSWRQLAWLLGAAVLAAYPIVVFGWPPSVLPLLGGPLLLLALCGAFLRRNGLPFDRWLAMRLAYLGRPRRLIWQPEAPATTPAARGGRWAPYRPTPIRRPRTAAATLLVPDQRSRGAR